MRTFPAWGHLLLVALFATGCGGGGGDSTDPNAGDPPEKHACELPCLDGAPTMDKTQIASATGGNVRVTFDIRGELTNVAEVAVAVTSDEGDPFPITAGLVQIPSPTQAHNEVDIPISAGTAPGAYHMYVAITPVSPEGSGSTYFVRVTESTAYYTYSENVGGTVAPDLLTSFLVPRLQIL